MSTKSISIAKPFINIIKIEILRSIFRMMLEWVKYAMSKILMLTSFFGPRV